MYGAETHVKAPEQNLGTGNRGYRRVVVKFRVRSGVESRGINKADVLIGLDESGLEDDIVDNQLHVQLELVFLLVREEREYVLRHCYPGALVRIACYLGIFAVHDIRGYRSGLIHADRKRYFVLIEKAVHERGLSARERAADRRDVFSQDLGVARNQLQLVTDLHKRLHGAGA